METLSSKICWLRKIQRCHDSCIENLQSKNEKTLPNKLKIRNKKQINETVLLKNNIDFYKLRAEER